MKTQTRRFTSTLYCVVSVIIGLVLTALPTKVEGQGVVAYMATGSTTNPNFLMNMAYAMENGVDSYGVTFIPNGGTIPVSQILVYPGNIGNKLYSGAVFTSSSTFDISQCSSLFASPSWSFTNSLASFHFGSGTIGILWGPGGPGTGDTVYTSGSATGVSVNVLISVVNSFSFPVYSGQTEQNALDDFSGSYGNQLPVTGTYYLNGIHGSTTTTLAVPEPTTITISSIGVICFVLGLARKK